MTTSAPDTRASLIELDVLGLGAPLRARRQLTVCDVAGTPVARLSLVPSLLIHRSLAALRRGGPPLAGQRATTTIADAGRAFVEGSIDGLTLDQHERLVSAVTGMPLAAVRAASGTISRAASEVQAAPRRARPVGAALDWRDPLVAAGHAVWTRRGDVLAVHAAGNHPALHTAWLEALALGFRVVVRPSRRDPLTPYRLVVALRQAGFADDQLMLLPCEPELAGELVAGADLALVYGGEDVVRSHRGDARVLVQGPGRSRILVADGAWEQRLDTIVASICHDGGMACVNASAVLVAGDPAPLAVALAERLAALPSLPPCDEDAVLPVAPLERARALERFLLDRAGAAVAHLGGGGIVDELADGAAVLRPAVFELRDRAAGQLALELPFPCVWVARWSPSDGVAPLRDALALTVMGADAQLIDAIVAEPTIANVHIGAHPTHWSAPGLPHDGYLAEFLMRTKTVICDRAASSVR